MKDVYVSAGDMDWQPAEGYPDGAMQKVLHEASASTPRSILLKIEPGWLMEEHSHIHAEVHYVLEGEYESQDNVYPAGSFRMIPAHTRHGPFTTIGGAVILVIWMRDLV
jgi:anti-sigma factor ChrR (cupin superfamily)